MFDYDINEKHCGCSTSKFETEKVQNGSLLKRDSEKKDAINDVHSG